MKKGEKKTTSATNPKLHVFILSDVTMMLVQRLQMLKNLLNLALDFVLVAAQALGGTVVPCERRVPRLAYSAFVAAPLVPLLGLFP